MKMKKLLVTLLALIFILGTVATGMAAAPLADVEGTDYEDAVTRLTALGIIGGYPDGTYKPEKPVTRAEFAKIIVTALGVGQAAEYAKGATKFSDVPATHWASGYINVATDMGVINGYPDGTFKPSKEVSYAEAITMIVRALGYEPKAKALGGYPGGYLAIAAEEGITEDITVVNSLAANRGDVAIMVNAALEVPMMYQKTWGQYPEYAADNPDKTLLKEKLDVEEVAGRVTDIPRTDDNLDDDEIKITINEFTDDEETNTYTVVCDADFEYLFGLEVTALVKDDEVIGFEIDSDVYFDAIEVNADGDEVTLVDADDDYDIDDNVIVYVNGSSSTLKAKDEFDYAKVVLNDEGDVIFVDAYDWEDYFVVEDVDEDIIYSYGDELDVEDYTIVKDGKEITADDIEKGDIFFFNETAEYAEVFNKTVKGKIDKVFTDAFELDNDEEFDIAGEYLDDDELKALDIDALESMEEEGDEVVVYLDRAGNVVFVEGDLGEEETSSFYAYVTENTTSYQDREKVFWTLDVVNEKGEQVDYDVEGEGVDAEGNPLPPSEDVYSGTWGTEIKAGAIVEITVDADGKVDKVELLTAATTDTGGNTLPTTGDPLFETDDNYFGGYKLDSDAVVFITEDYDSTKDYDEDDNYIEVKTFGKLDFDEVEAANIYPDSDDVVVVMVVSATDREEDTTDYAGIVTDVKEFSDSDVCKLTLLVDGEEKVFYTEDDSTVRDAVYNLADGTIIEFTFDNNADEITSLKDVVGSEDPDFVEGTIDPDGISVGDKEITVGGTTYDVSDAVIYDATDTSDITKISIRDLDEGDTVQFYLFDDNSRFVKYVLLITEAQ